MTCRCATRRHQHVCAPRAIRLSHLRSADAAQTVKPDPEASTGYTQVSMSHLEEVEHGCQLPVLLQLLDGFLHLLRRQAAVQHCAHGTHQGFSLLGSVLQARAAHDIMQC